MTEITFRILRNPFLRRQIAIGLGITVQKLLRSLLNRMDDSNLDQQSRSNERKTLELTISALLAEDLFTEGFMEYSIKNFRHVCALAHLRLGGHNLCFIRIAQSFRFVLGKLNERLEEAQNLFTRVISVDSEVTRLGVVVEKESFKPFKLFYFLKTRRQLPDVPPSFEFENDVFKISDSQSDS